MQFVERSCVLAPDSDRPLGFKANIVEDGTKLVYELEMLPSEDEKDFADWVLKGINLGMHSGGVSATMKYSPNLRELVGNRLLFSFAVGEHVRVDVWLRLLSISLYEGTDKCFPWLCGKKH